MESFTEWKKISKKKRQKFMHQLAGLESSDPTEIVDYYTFTPDSIDEQEHKQKIETKLDYNERVKKMYKEDLLAMAERKRCMRCGDFYTEDRNFGWKCWYHPGKLDELTHGSFYTCCKKSAIPGTRTYEIGTRKGCKRCDHRDSRKFYTSEDDQNIPLCLISLGLIDIEQNKQNVLDTVISREDPCVSFYVLRRYEQ